MIVKFTRMKFLQRFLVISFSTRTVNPLRLQLRIKIVKSFSKRAANSAVKEFCYYETHFHKFKTWLRFQIFIIQYTYIYIYSSLQGKLPTSRYGKLQNISVTLSRVGEHVLWAQPYDLSIYKMTYVFVHLRKVVYRLGSVFNQASWEKLEINQLKCTELHWHREERLR